jgi:hypothetical protein
MDNETFACHYDAGAATLEMRGTIDQDSWPKVDEAVDRAFRRTACVLTIDLTRVDRVPAHLLGRLVHLCNSRYPGTVLRLPARTCTRAIA